MRSLKRLILLAALFLAVISATADAQSLASKLKTENIAALAKAARTQGDAVRGAVLFPQQKLGCANCHAVGGKQLLGPDLSNLGDKVTDEYLVEAILAPSKEIKKGFESVTLATNGGKVLTGRVVDQGPRTLVLRVADGKSPASGGQLITLAKANIDEMKTNGSSTMPDNLVDQLSSRQQFLDLVKYMMALAAAGPNVAVGAEAGGRELSDELKGLMLIDNLNCTACHNSATASSGFPSKQVPDLAWSSGKIDPLYIQRFIADPLNVKPGTTMPNVMSGLEPDARRETAEAITHYLVSLGTTTFERQPIDSAAAKRGQELFHSVGCVACHSPRGDDWSELLPKSSVPLGSLQQKYNVVGLVALLKDPHGVRPSGRMPNMQLTHFEATDIAHYLLHDAKVEKQSLARFTVDRALAEKGKQHFDQLGCVQCHSKERGRVQPDQLPLARLRTDHGCLSGKAGKWPQYQLDDTQRGAILAAISKKSSKLTDEQQIELALTTFNCTACHQRGDLGGVTAERDDFFQTTNPNLGPQGRIPPPLTGVGAKLKPKAIRDVLVNGHAIRPYMKTRMPQFGAKNVEHLIELFQRVDQLSDVQFAKFTDQKLMKNTGAELAGSGGLNCIACHTFQQKPAQTMPAVDLTVMADRLHKDWFYHYMHNPQRFNPGTVMPSFWPGGQAMRKDVLSGDANLQVEALWQYLLDGRQARTPRGLVVEPIELVANDEAVMLRRSYQSIGKRGIGVGYPNQVNLAFDAEQMRLAMIWKGKFADPGGVWRSQGHGRVRPLGTDLFEFAAGPELDDAKNPWQVDEGRPPRHQFRGYYLDDKQRPTFMYRFDNMDVEDYPVDESGDESGTKRIRRTLTFSSDKVRGNVSFRAATGKTITPDGDNSFLIDKKLRVHLGKNHKANVIDVPAGKQLQVPLEIIDGKLQLVLEYEW